MKHVELRRELLVIHATYPASPSYCVENILARVPYARLELFETKRARFEQAAKQCGIDTAGASFSMRSGNFGGVIKDLSALIVPIPGSSEYYRIAFYT